MIVSLTSSWEISANTKLLSPSITSTFLDHIRSEVIISCQSLGFYRGIFTKRYEKMIEFVGDVVTISWIRQYRTSSRVQAVSVCLPDWGLIVSRFADFIPNQLAFWWLDRRFYLATQNPEGFPFTRFGSLTREFMGVITLLHYFFDIRRDNFWFFVYNLECSQGGVLISYTEKQVIETWHLIVVFKEADSVPRCFWDIVKEFISIKVLIQTGRDRNRLIFGELQIQIKVQWTRYWSLILQKYFSQYMFT